jgi:hypothetical protein
LRGGMVNFEDPKLRIGVTVGKGVEACAKQNVLSDTSSDSNGERVFSVSASRNQKSAKSNRERTVRPRRCAVKLVGVRVSQDRHSDWIIQDEGLRIVDLMCGAS